MQGKVGGEEMTYFSLYSIIQDLILYNKGAMRNNSKKCFYLCSVILFPVNFHLVLLGIK